MQNVLIIIHLFIVLALIVVVLLQRSEAGMGLGGGSSSVGGFMTGRGQANALTRATAILATLFFATSLLLGVLAYRGRGPSSIFEGTPPAPGTTAPGTPAPGGSILDQLRQQQGDSPAPGAPSAPPVPGVPATPPASPQ
jgi:preprotein translocase subunit SecG